MTHTTELFDFVKESQLYENIVFMQGGDADEALKIFDEKGGMLFWNVCFSGTMVIRMTIRKHRHGEPETR